MIKLSLKLLFLLLLVTQIVFSQVRLKIGTDPTNMTSSSAVLELESASKGLLLPRLGRTSVSNGTTIPSGLLIYDTAARCTRVYQNGVWSACLNAGGTNQSSNGTAFVNSYSCSTPSGNLIIGAASSATLTIIASVTTAGTYAITATANGVTFSGSGTVTTGNNTIILNSTGTPISASTTTFALNTNPSCSTTVSVGTAYAICDGTSPTEVVEIVSSTGKTWMDRNLGASRAATSANDLYAYGCLYQWGRGNDGHAGILWISSTDGIGINTYTTILSTSSTTINSLFIYAPNSPNNWLVTANTNLWQSTTQTNNPCPSGFRLPTLTEFTAEVNAYSLTTANLAYNSIFKFTTAGLRHSNTLNAIVNYEGTEGNYWTSSVYPLDGDSYGRKFTTNSSFLNFNRAVGNSVRCIKGN